MYMFIAYMLAMTTENTPASILNDILQIQRMDRGTVSIIRQGPEGPYYNHQCYEQGRNTSRYVPREQVPALQEAIEGYHRFQKLQEQYVELVVSQTRAERQAGLKKKPQRPKSSWPKNKKSNY